LLLGNRRCASCRSRPSISKLFSLWHSVREGWKEERTALLNRVRGLLAEYGVVIGRSADRFLGALPKLTEDSRVPDPVRALLLEAREQFAALHARLARCDAQIAAHFRNKRYDAAAWQRHPMHQPLLVGNA